MFVRIDINILQILFLHVNIISKKILFAKSCIIRKIYKNIYSYFKNLFFFSFFSFSFSQEILVKTNTVSISIRNVTLFQIFLKSVFKMPNKRIILKYNGNKEKDD